MEDGAPPHASQWNHPVYEEFYVRQLPWPGNSPDLNCIEPLWQLLKLRISKQVPHIRTMEEMEAAWYDEWEKLTIEEINAIIDRQVTRVRQVVDHKGGNDFHG